MKLFKLYLLLFFLPLFSVSQNVEIGVIGGGSYYYGDVSEEFYPENVRYSEGGFIGYSLSRRASIRLNAIYLRIAGIDSIGSSFQKSRNLNFYTDIYEGSIQYNYNLVEDRNSGNKVISQWIPYVFMGLGACYFIPKTEYLGSKFQLQPLKTSGISYSQVAVVVPIGVGFKYYLTPRIQLGFEGGMRLTSTSDLDDIRGNSVYPDPSIFDNPSSLKVYDRSNQPEYGKPGRQRGRIKWITDIYFVYGLTLSYRFGALKGGGHKSFGGGMKCPRFY